MDAHATAEATAAAVSKVGSHFMLAGATYKRGGELGFQGLDFYITGRGGVLGDVDADQVTAAFAFFEPEHIRTQWELGLAVMPAAEAAAAFAECGSTWAEANVPDDIDATRIAELAAKVSGGARLACAPVFAGWRRMIEVPSSPKSAAVHHMNALRELRQGLHAACIVASGLNPVEALALNQPSMGVLFGWPELPAVDGLMPRWEQAEAATTVAIAHAYEALTVGERSEFAELAAALHAATTA